MSDVFCQQKGGMIMRSVLRFARLLCLTMSFFGVILLQSVGASPDGNQLVFQLLLGMDVATDPFFELLESKGGDPDTSPTFITFDGISEEVADTVDPSMWASVDVNESVTSCGTNCEIIAFVISGNTQPGDTLFDQTNLSNAHFVTLGINGFTWGGEPGLPSNFDTLSETVVVTDQNGNPLTPSFVGIGGEGGILGIGIWYNAGFPETPSMSTLFDGTTELHVSFVVEHSPSDSGCDSQQGALHGLCTAYCEAMDCDGDDPQASANACERVLGNFKRAAGDVNAVPPCSQN